MALFRSSAKVELDEDMKQIQDSPSPEVAVWGKKWDVEAEVLSPHPPKFNIAPENRPSQKETHLPTIHFQGLF